MTKAKRMPIIERFELDTYDKVYQYHPDADYPEVGVVVVGTKIFVDGLYRGEFVDINVDIDYYTNYGTGENNVVYGMYHVLGQKVIHP